MKYVLSIDVGIVNLALCVMSLEKDKQYRIHYWDVIDTVERTEHFCKNLTKKGKVCGKKCLYFYKNKDKSKSFSCKTHFPPGIPLSLVKTKKIKQFTNHEICKMMINTIEDIYSQNQELFSKITDIVIELQPSINRKMVFTSNMLYCKLVDMYLDTNTTVKFVSASRKLKVYKGPYIKCNLKGKYAQRKWLAIEYCHWFLRSFDEEWSLFFNNKKTKADMADCFLMAMDVLMI